MKPQTVQHYIYLIFVIKSMKTIQTNNSCKTWWEGSPQVEPFMEPIISVIAKYHTPNSPEFVDIYNRTYEMAYNIIKKYNKNKMYYIIKISGLWQKTTKDFWNQTTLQKFKCYEDSKVDNDIIGYATSNRLIEECGYKIINKN